MTKPLVDTVKQIAGPFDDEEDAYVWHFDEANYDPRHAVVKGFNGKWYVADVSEERKRVGAGDADLWDIDLSAPL